MNSENLKRKAINSGINAAAAAKQVYHPAIEQLTSNLVDKLRNAGMRSGEIGRNMERGGQMLEKIPPSQRADFTPDAAVDKLRAYLNGKDASHIKAHANGGSSAPDNLMWESSSINRARGNRDLTRKERMGLQVEFQAQNLNGAFQMGVRAAGRGAIIGAATAVPFALLRNFLAVARGEISSSEAAKRAALEVGTAAGVGAGAAFSITTIAALFPPVAVALSTIAPGLLAVGGTLMVKEFFDILIQHEDAIRERYRTLTEQELERLDEIATQIEAIHSDNLNFLDRARLYRESLAARGAAPSLPKLPTNRTNLFPES